MNFQIARLRLASVGPEPARFDPLDLTLSSADGSGPEDTVLFLQNTGGKTVLLRLLFSVLHPPVVGKIGSQEAGRQSQSFPDYVLADDTAHIIIEWRHTKGGRFCDDEVLITGLAAQWRGGRPTTSAEDLDKEWYTIRGPADRIGLDRLILDTEVQDNGNTRRRRLPLHRFREQLRELARSGPRGGPLVTSMSKQTAWIKHLDEIGLDRVLLRYQGEMNTNEAGASSIARFRTDLDFIAFFLGVVMDPEELEALDKEFAQVASKVQRYPLYERRLRFEDAALEKLEALAGAVAAAHDAAARARQVREAGLILRAQFTGAFVVSRDREQSARNRWHRCENDAGELSSSADRLRAEWREYRRMGAQLWLGEASTAFEEAERRQTETGFDVRAWAIAEDLVRLREAKAEFDVLEAEFRAEMARLRPLHDARDDAASALARRLATDAVLATREAGLHETRAKAARARAVQLRHDEQQSSVEAAKCEVQREGHERQLEAIAVHRARLVAQGYVGADERAVEARDRENLRVSEAQTRIEILQAELDALEAERGALDDEERAAGPLRMEAKSNCERVTTEIGRAQAERARLAAEPPVVELAEEAVFDLELVGPAIAERLLGRAREAEAKRLDLELRGIDDRRALRGLDESGFLPPPPEVEEALARLRAAGIAGATPGTRYVAEAVSAGHRRDVVARRADLVGGIVLTDPADLPRARAVLESASLTPSIIIAVGAGAALIDAETAADVPATFVIPPTEAIWDRAVAADERARRETRLAALDDERTKIDTRATCARTLADALVRHAAEYPAGWLAARVAEQEGFARTRARLDAEHEHRNARRGEIVGAVATRRDESAKQQKVALDAERRRGALDPLVEREAEIPELEASIERLRGEAAEWRARAAEYAADAQQADEEVARADRTAADQRSAAERIRREQSAILLAASVFDPSPEEAARIVAGSDRIELRARFAVLDEQLKGELSTSQVAARREAAVKARGRLEATVGAHAPDVRARGEALIATPEAGTLEGRRAAAERAQGEADSARDARTQAYATRQEAKKDLESIESEIRQAKRTAKASDLRVPADRHEAARFAAHARQVADGFQDRARVAERDAQAAKSEAEAARLLADMLGSLVEQLRLGLRQPTDAVLPDAAPFVGNADAVRAAAADMLARLTDVTEAEERATKARLERDSAVRQLLTREEFMEVARDRLYHRLATSTPDALAESVGELVVELRVSIGVLREELASLAQDFKLATTSLAKSVNKAISYLRLAERLSKMPATLRDWAGVPFLTIRFNKSDDLDARLATFVTEILAHPTNRPTGTTLLLQALARAVGQFTVQILKPNEAFEPKRVSITELYSSRFSNGQRSTVATALMLMLSELRRQSRSAARTASLGTIMLDNPFGNANAGFLIEVQRTVAAAAGIQLLYTTGITDLSALRHFPNVIALSNDAARRRMLRYVRTNPALLNLLVPSENGPGGRVSATRVVVRPNEDGSVRR